MTPEEMDKYAEPTRPNTRLEILQGALHEGALQELKGNGGEIPNPLERYVLAVIGDQCGLVSINTAATLKELGDMMSTADAHTEELNAYDLDEDGQALSFSISFKFTRPQPPIDEKFSVRVARMEDRLAGTVALTGNEYAIPNNPGRYLIEEKSDGDTVWAMNCETLDEAADLINMSETERTGVIIFDLDFTGKADDAELIPSITVTAIYGTDWKPKVADISPEEANAKERALLQAYFPYLGTDEHFSGSECVERLNEWWTNVGGTFETGDDDDTSQQPSKCDNCAKVWKDYQLDPSKDLHERMDEGGPMPSGDCPECGAFCYPVKEQA